MGHATVVFSLVVTCHLKEKKTAIKNSPCMTRWFFLFCSCSSNALNDKTAAKVMRMLAAAQNRQIGTNLKTVADSESNRIGAQETGVLPPKQGPLPMAMSNIPAATIGAHFSRPFARIAAENRKTTGAKLPAPTKGLRRPLFHGYKAGISDPETHVLPKSK